METRNGKSVSLIMDASKLVKGEEYAINIYAGSNEVLSGMQMSLSVKGLRNVAVQGGMIDIQEENFALNNDQLNISWTTLQNADIERGDVLFTIVGTASQAGIVSESISINEESKLRSELYSDKFETKDIEIQIRELDENATFAMYQNEPNPFNDQTTLSFDLPESNKVQLNIVDITGKRVHSESSFMTKGANTFVVTGSDLGESGIYYYTITTGEISQTKKMIFVK